MKANEILDIALLLSAVVLALSDHWVFAVICLILLVANAKEETK